MSCTTLHKNRKSLYDKSQQTLTSSSGTPILRTRGGRSGSLDIATLTRSIIDEGSYYATDSWKSLAYGLAKWWLSSARRPSQISSRMNRPIQFDRQLSLISGWKLSGVFSKASIQWSRAFFPKVAWITNVWKVPFRFSPHVWGNHIILPETHDPLPCKEAKRQSIGMPQFPLEVCWSSYRVVQC